MYIGQLGWKVAGGLKKKGIPLGKESPIRGDCFVEFLGVGWKNPRKKP